MAIEAWSYLEYPEAVALHFELMLLVGETRFGVFDRTLIESALARPQQAAHYQQADLWEQAATLCYGLIKNHPWIVSRRQMGVKCRCHLDKVGSGAFVRKA